MATNAENNYTFRSSYPDFLQRGRDNRVSLPVYLNGALVAPNSATFTLLGPAGATVVATAAATISGSIATYTILAASLPSTLDYGEGYVERWVLTLPDSTIRTVDREACVAKVNLYPVITDADLQEFYPDIATLRGSQLTSFQTFIDGAWKLIVSRMMGQGVIPYLVKSPEAFRASHINLTFAHIFQWAAKNQVNRGNYNELAEKHKAAYEAEWAQINFKLDRDQDGLIDDPYRRENPRGAVIHRSAAPSERWFPRRDRRW